MSFPRSAYTLMELLIATASASALMVGLSGSLLISSHALDIDEGVSMTRIKTDVALERVLADVQMATRFIERTSTALEFEVPDRNEDNQPENLRYEWSGLSGDPLTRSYNEGVSQTVIQDVRLLDFGWFERDVVAIDPTVPPPVPWPVVESYELTTNLGTENQLALSTPSDVQEGDLLLAAVVVKKNVSSSFVAPVGWSYVDVGHGQGEVSVGVWWKFAGVSEAASHTWQWTDDHSALGWMLRITNTPTYYPFAGTGSAVGTSSSPTCADVSSSANNSLVIRIGGFRDDDITTGEPGLSGHTAVLMEGANGVVSGGCGYKPLPEAGNSDGANFALSASEEFRTVTVIVQPAP